MKKFIPLWCWCFTFLLVIAVILISYWQGYSQSETELEDIKQIENASLMSFWNTARLQNLSRNSVVAIGTSLVRHGFYYDTLFDQQSEAKKLELQLLRFHKDGALSDDFIWLLRHIDQSSTAPQIILLQLEPFMFNPSAINGNYLSNVQKNLHLFIRTLIGAPSTAALSGNYGDDALMQMNKSAKLFDMMKGDVREHRLTTPTLSPQFQAALDNLSKKGSKVIFIRMNYASQRYLYINPRNINELSKPWIETFKQATGYPVWEFNSLDMSYYKDTAHLNAKGRVVFTEWLLDKIQQEDVL